MDIFACTQCAIRTRFLFFKLTLVFVGAPAFAGTLRRRRHAIRRASEPTIVRRYSLLDTPAVYQRASTPPPAPVVIVLRKRSTASRQGGREFRSVGSIKERGTNWSIDISEGPHVWYNKAWARSNRAGQVRGQALSVNQGKWFVKGRVRACEIGHALRDATRGFSGFDYGMLALNYKTNFRSWEIEVEEVAMHNNETAGGCKCAPGLLPSPRMYPRLLKDAACK